MRKIKTGLASPYQGVHVFGFWRDQTINKALKLAKQAHDAGDHQQALRQLRLLLPNPDYSIHKRKFVKILKMLKVVGGVFGGDEFVDKINPVLRSPDDREHLYQLGYDLIEYGLHAFATLPLYRVHHLVPNEATIISELAAALEGLMMSEKIVTLILNAAEEIQEDPVCFYLLIFHLIMSGQIDDASARLPRLAALMKTEEQQFMVSRVTKMIQRAELIKPITGLSDQDLVGWHFVKTGGMLTYTSPYGFDEGMSGRFAFTQDSYARCRYGIEQLVSLLDGWELKPPKVFYGRDRSSHVLGLAVAELLGTPAEPLVQASGPGLIVFYDLAQLEGDDWDRVTLHQAGRPLFVHAVNWVEPPPISPDVLTYLYQTNCAPWERQMRVTEEHTTEWSEPDERSPAAISADILNAPSLDEEELSKHRSLTPLAEATQSSASAFVEEGYRERFWQGGPVKSSMFI